MMPCSPADSATPRRRLAALLVGLLALPALGAQGAVGTAIDGRVRSARAVAPELGVHVVDLASGEAVYAFEADRQRIVASNTKLFTAAAALDQLGPGYAFETDVVVRGTIADGTLHGDLGVVGGGDPNLSGRFHFDDPYGPFREWAAALSDRGIRRIRGDLVLAHGFFDDQRVHPDWPRDQLARWYEAPVEALSFNDNCVLVEVEPDPRDSRATVRVLPELGLYPVESTARLAGSGGTQVAVGRRDGTDIVTVAGAVARGSVHRQAVTVGDPLRYFAAALRQALAEEGVLHDGRAIAVERLPRSEGSPPWRLVHTHRSDLLTTLEVVNKRSQNFYAESVLKALGAERCGGGTWEAGTEVVRELLDRVGLPRDGYGLADGSGMSRGNRFTPRQITTLLGWMFRHRWGSEFVATLPYAGERGLGWEKRLAAAPYAGNVMAKTGTLAGVSTLSGYAKARSGRLYAFSILMNAARTTWQARDAQDAIVRALVDHG